MSAAALASGAARRAWFGATKAAPAGFTIGIAIGLAAGLPIIHLGGAGVILAMTTGALVGLLRG